MGEGFKKELVTVTPLTRGTGNRQVALGDIGLQV